MMDVSNIQEGAEMADQERKTPAPVPFNAFEAVCTIHERHVRRLLIALMISMFLFAVSNGAWLYAWMQYDYTDSENITETDVSQDGRGINIYGDGNEVQNHGTADTYQDDNEDTDQD